MQVFIVHTVTCILCYYCRLLESPLVLGYQSPALARTACEAPMNW